MTISIKRKGSLGSDRTKDYYTQMFDSLPTTRRYPSTDLVRLEKYHFGGKGGGLLLEYGPGTGHNLVHLLECGYEIEGLDISPGALRRSEETIRQRFGTFDNRTTLRLLQTEDDQLPYDDSTFDYVNCMSVLSLLGNRVSIMKLLAEFRRVMKNGAKIIVDINGRNSDFAQKGTLESPNDPGVFCYGSPSMLVYCPNSAADFSDIVSPYFDIDDIGTTTHKYFGQSHEEYLICAHKRG